MPVLGLDTSKPGEFLDPRATPDSFNMEMNRSIIRKRLGTVSVGSSLGERIMNYSELQIQNAIYVVRVGLTDIQVLNQTTRTWASIAHAALTGTQADKFSFAFPLLTGAKIMVFTNGVDVLRKFTGTGNDANLGGSPPIAKFCIAYKTYLVLAYITTGGNTYSTRLQWSDTADPENWSTGNSGSVDLVEDSQDITGLGVFGDFITVHKDSSIYVGSVVTTGEIFRFDRKATGVGAVSQDTIHNIPTGEQIFLARDGIHLFNGITAPLIQSPIMDEMREQMSPSYIYKSWGVIVRELDEYWVGVPLGSDTEPTTIYKYNYRTGQVFKDSRSVTCAGYAYDKTSQLTWNDKTNSWDSDVTRWNDVIYSALNPTIIFGDTSGNSTERSAINNDNGVAISSYWVSKDFTAGDIAGAEEGRLVRWTSVQVWAKGNTVLLEYSTDGGTTWATLVGLTLASDYPTDAAPLYGYFDVVSTQIRFRFSNATAGESFTLEKFNVYAILRELRQ